MSTNHGVRLISIGENSHQQRLDNFLLRELKGVPKSLIYRIIRKGEVRVNKGRAKPETRLNQGDTVRVPPLRTSDRVMEHKPGAGLLSALEKAVVYESDALMVVNKPAGLAVHGGSGVKLGLIEALRAGLPAYGSLELVHRLDRDTSGCIMVAKKRSMLRYLQDLLRREGQIVKRYFALLDGEWPKSKKLVDAPLHRIEAKNGERFVEVNDALGKPSRTRFTIKEQFSDCTLVEAQPMTGRTHQIRVHAKNGGHALIGDTKYGDEKTNTLFKKYNLKRLFLHAHSLHIPLPDGNKLAVEAPLPEDLQRALIALKRRDS